MSLTKCAADTNNISSLSDRPALTATELKAKFDKAGTDIKSFLNNTLTNEVDNALANKVNAEANKSLMTSAERTKLQGVEAGATNIENYISMGSTAPGSGTTGIYYFQYFN